VAGPTLFFLALEHGGTFTARAAETTLAGLVGVAAFAVAYAWVSLRRSWWWGLLGGWAAFGAVTGLLQVVVWRPDTALAAALGAFALARASLPRRRGMARPLAPPAWDLPVRMATAAAVVLTVTGLSGWLGPRLSGALTPFPVATAILLAFAQAQQGAPAALGFLRGFLPAMWSFAIFCFVVATVVVPLGPAGAFVAALAAQLAAHGLVLLGFRTFARL